MPALSSPTPTASSTGNRIPGYSAIEPNVLQLLERVDVDLFVLPDGADFPVLLRKAGLEVTPEQLRELVEERNKRMFVCDSDYKGLTEKLIGSLDRLVQDESLPATDRFSLLQIAAAAEVEHACTLLNPSKFVSLSQKLGDNLTKLITTGDVVPEEIFRVAKHDYQTFTHVTNVSLYATLMAEELGIHDEAELREIAIGGMLHDVGKRMIPGEILRKPGKLDDKEREIIQAHPQRGYEELVDRDDLSYGQLMMVYQHHERMDGGGYPVGIMAGEMHPWARMLAVVDVFDAMTGSRPYRQPATPQDAMGYITSQSGKHFDPEMVRCWTKVMAAI